MFFIRTFKYDKLFLEGEVIIMVEGYCMKCKAKREMKDIEEVTMKNGRKAYRGVCPVCGTKMFKIKGKDDVAVKKAA